MLWTCFVSMAFAVEGMWEPSQLGGLGAPLRAAGYLEDPSRLSDVTGAPLGAVASLGGCTASFVSDLGLLVTNHHCVTGMLQRAQREGEDLLVSGFYAPNRAEERPTGAGTRVYVTQSLEDATTKVVGTLPAKLTDRQRTDAIDHNTKKLVAACEAPGGTRCRVAAFYEGSRYTLVRQLEIRDVRVVMAPPEMVGNFGDEVDNWHWPRHTGDFSFIRAYVGRDGKPADFAASNVPYTPKRHLTVSTRGVEPGEFVMLASYPGTTRRWRSALELERQATLTSPGQIEHLGWVFDLLTSTLAADPSTSPMLGVPRLGLGNAVFKAKAMVDGFARGKVVERALARDAALDAWVAADAGRAVKYGPSFAELRETITRRDATRRRDELMDYLGRSDLLGAARSLYRWSIERPLADVRREAGYQDRDVARAKARFDDMQRGLHVETDRRLVGHFLSLIFALPEAEQPAELRGWMEKNALVSPENASLSVAFALDHLYRSPALVTSAARLDLFDRPRSAFEGSADGFLSLAVALRPYDEAREAAQKEDDGAFSRLRPVFVGALRTFEPARAYPDANGTLRVTFGTVQGYKPRDAVSYAPQTTVAGIVEKAGPWPFAAPAPLLAAIDAGKWGPYADPSLGTVPVDFLADLDITGGSSGSPTLDARGRLVGLAFDSNYEGIGSDWMYNGGLSRSVHVDIRYLLWYLDAVAQADGLLTEMGISPAI